MLFSIICDAPKDEPPNTISVPVQIGDPVGGEGAALLVGGDVGIRVGGRVGGDVGIRVGGRVGGDVGIRVGALEGLREGLVEGSFEGL